MKLNTNYYFILKNKLINHLNILKIINNLVTMEETLLDIQIKSIALLTF